MAPPPLGDPRVPNPAPPGNSRLLGSAYGASFRLINPKVNNTENFVAAWLGAGFLLTPKSNTITASIGQGFAIGGFSDYFFENEAIIHDVVTELVQGEDIFVSISAGDGQTETSVAMNPNGLTGPTEVTTDPNVPVDIDDPDLWLNPSYSYGLTVEPQFVIDSGSNDAAPNTLNDVYNNSPFNSRLDNSVSHSQHTTETRWTGQQNFHTGFGSRANVSAPGDDILIMAQVEDANGDPVDPVSSFPRLIGGSSASAPEVAGAAAVVRQAARALGTPLSATQIRSLLFATGRRNVAPAFDLSQREHRPVARPHRGRAGAVRPRAREREPVVRAHDGRAAQGGADADRPALELLQRHAAGPAARHRDDRPLAGVWWRRPRARTRPSARPATTCSRRSRSASTRCSCRG